MITTIGSTLVNYSLSEAANEIVAQQQDVLGHFLVNYTAATYSLLLQNNLEEYMSKGSWVNDQWVSSASMKYACPSFNKYQQPENISVALTNLMIEYIGDIITRSDLYAWGEQPDFPRTNLDKASVFHRI